MDLLAKIGHWMQGEDYAIPGDVLVILDGPDFEHRLAAGLDLLQRGFASQMLIHAANSNPTHCNVARTTAALRPGKIRVIPGRTGSLWDEALEIRTCLQGARCASAIIVTSWYRARRTRMVFARALCAEGIKVIACPVRAPRAAGKDGTSREARSAILLEPIKLLCAFIRPAPPGTAENS
jgi:DUF218 domain